jgi:O-acetyl-ADP-ribose deacetylase (regulator of RNase III)
LLDAEAEALVNTVNCVGIMGKGVALQFKHAYPENFRAYERACKDKEVVPGRMFVFERSSPRWPRYIINFPTKRHWRQPSKIEDIDAGLDALRAEIEARGIKSIALPPLGCGNGGLDWNDVEPLIRRKLSGLQNVEVLVHPPQTAPPPDAMPLVKPAPRLSRVRASFIAIMARYQAPGYLMGKLEAQKLAYFLQEAGEPMKLRFAARQFGPYCDTVNHILLDLEGHYIRGYGDRSGKAAMMVLPEGRREAMSVVRKEQGARTSHEAVAQLIRGFETPYGMELLGTVHWVGARDPNAAHDSEVAVKAVHDWSERKRDKFSAHDIRIAWKKLKAQGWGNSTRLHDFERIYGGKDQE